VRFFIRRETALKRLAFIVFVAVLGTGVLLSLGKWQMDRLAWKEAILQDIIIRISATPQSIPQTPDPEGDRYLSVLATGTIEHSDVRVLASRKHIGAGYRIISPFVTNGRRILLDRGFIKTDAPLTPPPESQVEVVGNLHWPEDADQYTPEPDIKNNIWFAREVSDLAQHFDTEPILIIASNITPATAHIAPLPVDTAGIPNDHLQYAITWFSLAAVWTIMSFAFLWNTRHRTEGKD